MKKIILIFYLITVGTLIAGANVPLSMYHKSYDVSEINVDEYLWQTLGIYSAITMGNLHQEEELLRRFDKLSVHDEFLLIWMGEMLKKNRKVKKHYFSYYFSALRQLGCCDRTEQPIFFVITTQLYRYFCTKRMSAEDNQRKLYQYMMDYYVNTLSQKKKISSAKILFFVDGIRLSARKMLENDKISETQKREILTKIIHIINTTDSNEIKTRLTQIFIQYMSSDQLALLKTTDYALVLSFPIMLYLGKLKMIFPYFAKILDEQENIPYLSSELAVIQNDLRFTIPIPSTVPSNKILAWITAHMNKLQFNNATKKYFLIP